MSKRTPHDQAGDYRYRKHDNSSVRNSPSHGMVIAHQGLHDEQPQKHPSNIHGCDCPLALEFREKYGDEEIIVVSDDDPRLDTKRPRGSMPAGGAGHPEDSDKTPAKTRAVVHRVENAYWAQQLILEFERGEMGHAHETLAWGGKGDSDQEEMEAAEAHADTQQHVKAHSFYDALLYYVTAEVYALVGAAAASMPLHPIRREEIPAFSGVIAFENFPPHRCKWKGHEVEPLWALSWYTIPDGPVVMSYTDAPLSDVDEWTIPLHPTGEASALWNVEALEEQPWIRAFWAFIRQELLSTERGRLPRAKRRELARKGAVEPFINVIRLRKVHHRAAANGEPSAIEYDHRWMVRGHWHNYWKGPLEGERYLEAQFVAPYIKGPDDKPFQPPKPTVFDVSR